MPQWQPALEKLAALKEQRTALDNEIKEMETVLKLVHRQAGTRDWVDTGGTTAFACTMPVQGDNAMQIEGVVDGDDDEPILPDIPAVDRSLSHPEIPSLGLW